MAINILVAPLNWGLGHATRCVPIINELISHGFTPILASDGVAGAMLRKEFPSLQTLELPSYGIEYAKNGKNFKWKMFKNSPKMIKAIFQEKQIVKEWIKKYNLHGIISDNRFGVRSKKIPSVFITHQINVLTGNTTWITSKLHQKVIRKFNECWIPDFKDKPNLTGKLGHAKDSSINIKYIGPLSRLKPIELTIKYDLMVLLSGPEPQRTILEENLKSEVLKFDGNVIFIKGVVAKDQIKSQLKNVTLYNFMNTSELEIVMNQSEIVLCRSGYTTIMDLVKLGKKAYFIPTPGQYEQEYLAKRFKRNGFFPYANQDDFKIEDLLEIDLYKKVERNESSLDWKQLFSIFNK